jgi:hypothetical protein
MLNNDKTILTKANKQTVMDLESQLVVKYVNNTTLKEFKEQ